MKGLIQYIIIFLLCILISSCSLFRHSKSTKSTVKENSKNKAQINLLIKTALEYSGTKYKLGGMDKSGIDCSGLVKISFEKINIVLPRRSIEQYKLGKEVELKNCKVGDLIFFKFDDKSKNEIDHVGIISNVDVTEAIKFIHASTKLGVIEDDLSKTYNKKVFVKCIRIIE